MKIKNLFFIGFAATSLFVACEEKGDEISGTPSIELSTNTLEFEQAADSETITLTANRDWVVEVPSSASSWLKVSPTSGSASDEPQTITIEVTENEGINRSAELEFNASLVSDKLKITQKGPGGEIDTDGINDVTVAEFIAAEVNDGDDAPLYRITGTLTYVRSSRYGNVYIEDNTGTVYAYGLCSDENLTYESYGNIEGLTIGDKVTVVGKRGEHEGTIELVDCYYESHEDAFINPTPKEVSLADFLAAEVSYSMDAYYQITGTITKIENATYGNIYIEDEAGTEVYIYGVAENNQLINASFGNIEGLNAGDIITVIGCRGEHKGSAQMVNGYYVSHVDGEEPEPGEILKVTVKEFLEKTVDDTYYQLTGTIANLTNATYGNFDLVDETGTVYVHGLKASQDASNQSFGELGLKEGDIVTLVGTRAEFKGEAQVGGAYYISHEPGEPVVSEFPWTLGEKAYTEEATVNGETKTVLKLGTSKLSGDATLTVPAGTKSMTFYAVSWKGAPSDLTFSGADGMSPATVSPAANEGASNSSPYTITVSDTDKYTVTFASALAADTAIKVVSSKRNILWDFVFAE